MAEHRMPMLGGPLRRYEDPARSSDPRIREIVAALATLEPAPAPRAHFRAELRAQLVAVAPRIVQESATEEFPAVRAAAAPTKTGIRGILAAIPLKRPLAAVACTVVVLAMLLGAAVLVSKRALPGDALYGVKRASENAQYALAQSPAARARLNLKFAGNRLEEVQHLLPDGSGVAPVSPHVASLVNSTLSSADADVLKAAQTLGEQAVQNNSATPLKSLTSWAPDELSRLSDIIDHLPDGTVRSRAQATYSVVLSAITRATALQAEAGCACLHSAPSDQFGPIPCPVCSATPDPTNQQPGGAVTVPGVTSPGTTTSPTDGVTPNTATGSDNTGSTTGGSDSSGSDTSAQPTTQPGLPLPTVSLPPLPSASLGPIGIGSCGIGISAGPIHLHLGTCAPSHS
jgi:hypothetical protein